MMMTMIITDGCLNIFMRVRQTIRRILEFAETKKNNKKQNSGYPITLAGLS